MMGKRILAFIIDYVTFMILLVLFGIVYKFEIVQNSKLFYISLFISLTLIYFKDNINAQSIGKRIVGLKVVRQNGAKPSFLQLFLRNLTFCLWPIEAILVLMEKPRLGERFTKTKVISNTKTNGRFC